MQLYMSLILSRQARLFAKTMLLTLSHAACTVWNYSLMTLKNIRAIIMFKPLYHIMKENQERSKKYC